jgi:hypothetical protein
MRIGPDPPRVKDFVTLIALSRGHGVTSEKTLHPFRVKNDYPNSLFE